MKTAFIFCMISVTGAFALSTSDYCLFSHELKAQFFNLSCDLENLDDCAMEARKIVQKSHSGNWGAILVDKQALSDEQVDLFFHTVRPSPGFCRLLINDTVLEIFRTGYRVSNPHKKHWSWKQTQMHLEMPNVPEICPHSSLRELVAIYSHASLKHRSNSTLFDIAKNLAHVFRTETGHNWNVLITKNSPSISGKIGMNFPYYLYDSRSGICVGSVEQYNIMASIIGFEDEHEEMMSDG